MYRGFNIKLSFKEDENLRRLKNIGRNLYQTNLQQVQFSINTFVNSNNSIDGSAIQSYWFPQIETDIFISHSHKDVDTALILSGWLWENFKLKAFIDSCIWGYSSILQKEIDDVHCFIPSRGVYSYELRNHSTSHVHMMLSTALTMMIDKSECLLFLNTPNSIKSYGDTDKTESPWIYSEIATSIIVEKKEPMRRSTKAFSHFEGIDEVKKGLTMTHDLELSHLLQLNIEGLNNWLNHKNTREHPLDTLYRLYPAKKKIEQKIL